MIRQRHRSVRLVAAAAVLSGLTLLPAAAAATPLTYVTPAWMSGKIHGLVPQIPTDNVSPPSTITQAACKGLPPAKAKKFNTFRCAASWDKGKAVVWARALPGGKYCASSTGLASCPAVPATTGDPRVCAVSPPAPSTADPNRCALGATEYAILRAMPVNFGDPGWAIRNISCTGSNLTRTCTFGSKTAYGTYYTSKVRFTQVEKAWTAAIATTGGGVNSTCTVVPGPSNGRTQWQAGPTPTCAAS
jgi:hypothetical protein